MKIAFLIPCTTKKRNHKSIIDTELYNVCIPSLLKTLNLEHEYKLYIGIDDDDKVFKQEYTKHILNEIISTKTNAFDINIEYELVEFSKVNGHVTKVWNGLFLKAYNDNFDYFVQCGDDIQYITNNWINTSLDILIKNNNIGVTGPFCENNRNFTLLTQSIVSRKHMEIFGYYFPEKIKNWCCDDWLSKVYQPIYFYKLTKHKLLNSGGEERYTIEYNDEVVKVLNMLVECGKKIICEYVESI